MTPQLVPSDVLHGLPILLVDDEPELREIFALWLQRRGCVVSSAGNGLEALEVVEAAKAAGTPICAMISDQHMPKMNGSALLRELRSRGHHMPALLFVSGFNEMPMREAYSLGVHATLTKPLRRNEMTEALERSLLQPSQRWQQADAERLCSATGTPPQQIAIDLPGFRQATTNGAVRFGFGGCSLPYSQSLHDGLADMELRFADGRTLMARGCVRWRDARLQRIGVEFLHMPEDTRTWLVPVIEMLPGCAYIPGE